MVKAVVKNWKTFQHYKDRSPLWIKLHRALLDNMDYHLLSDFTAKQLPLIWLIASESDGALPATPELSFRLRMSIQQAESVIAELIERNFLVMGAEQAQPESAQTTEKEWGSRHIPDKVKFEVMQRDGGVCCWCKSAENIEFDHITPISKGGKSTACNIQILCRSCNRKKRTRDAAQAEQLATQIAGQAQGLRSLEKEKEKEKREKQPAHQAARFDEFWSVYPVKKGRADAVKKWKLWNLDQIADQIIDDVKARKRNDRQWLRDGGAFIPHGSTYVNKRGWEDAIDASSLRAVGNEPWAGAL